MLAYIPYMDPMGYGCRINLSNSCKFHLITVITMGVSEKNVGAFFSEPGRRWAAGSCSGTGQGIAFRILPPAGHLVVERITPGTPAEALHLPKVHAESGLGAFMALVPIHVIMHA